MNLAGKDRKLVRDAALRVIGERQKFQQHAAQLRDGYDRYRPVLLLGGGFATGFLIGRKHFPQAVRSILSMASLGFSLMRSSLGSMLVAATLRNIPASGKATSVSAEEAQG